MTYLPSLPGDAVLLDVFRAYPGTSRPLPACRQALLRGPSPRSVAERELIAASVSGLNARRYRHGALTAAAEAPGISEGTPGALLDDIGPGRGAGDHRWGGLCPGFSRAGSPRTGYAGLADLI